VRSSCIRRKGVIDHKLRDGAISRWHQNGKKREMKLKKGWDLWEFLLQRKRVQKKKTAPHARDLLGGSSRKGGRGTKKKLHITRKKETCGAYEQATWGKWTRNRAKGLSAGENWKGWAKKKKAKHAQQINNPLPGKKDIQLSSQNWDRKCGKGGRNKARGLRDGRASKEKGNSKKLPKRGLTAESFIGSKDKVKKRERS